VIVDAHCHLDPELPVPRLIEAMDRAGIDRAVLLAAANTPTAPVPRAGAAFFRACMRVPALRMPLYRTALRNPRVGRVAPRPDNEAVLETALAHPDRFIPYVFLNPTLGQEAHDELDRAVAAGARGVKLHPWLHEYRITDALQILKRCEALCLPVLAHLGMGPAEDVAAVIDQCPRLKLVLAHAGIPHYERLWRLDRILFDIALPQLTSARLIRRLLRRVGPQRVVFGSDAPTGIRVGNSEHAYRPPSLPNRAMGENLLGLLE
jgi:hypothetical protein